MAATHESQKSIKARLYKFDRPRAQAPLGKKIYVSQGLKYLKKDPKQRATMRLVELLRDEHRLTWRDVTMEIERRTAEAEGRKPLAYRFQPISRDRIMALYKAEKRLQAEELADLDYVAELHGITRETYLRHLEERGHQAHVDYYRKIIAEQE